MKRITVMKIPRVPVTIVQEGKTFQDTAMVIPEIRFDVRLNDRTLSSIICRPENPEEPCVGFLHSHGIFSSRDGIKTIRVFPQEKVVAIQAQVHEKATEALALLISKNDRSAPLPEPPAKGKTGKKKVSQPSVGKENFRGLASMASQFQEILEVKGIFGAYNVAALANKKGRLLCQAGDTGMSITVDRVIGKAFLSGLTLANTTLLISGRLKADTVLKAAYHGIPRVVTSSVITQLAMEAANSQGIEVIHTKEDRSMAIYHDHEAESPAPTRTTPEGKESGLSAGP
jgi:FdhD protein